MSLGVTVVRQHPRERGGLKRVIADLTFDAAYNNPGGYTLTPADFGLRAIEQVHGTVPGFVPAFSRSAGKLALYIETGNAGAMAECADNQSGLDTVVGTFTVEGY